VRSLRSLSKPFILFQRYTPAVHIIAHQNTRVNIARPFSGTGNVCGDRVLCLNIELSIAVAAPRVRFPFLFIVLFLSLCTVWLGLTVIGVVLISCV
jgi:hypothetical protein